MPKLVRNGTSFVPLGHLAKEILDFMIFKMMDIGYVGFWIKHTSKPKSNHSIGFGMSKLVGNDTSFVFLGHLGPEILNFMIFKMASAAILNMAL